MGRPKGTTKERTQPWGKRVGIRFKDESHGELCTQAAKLAGLTLNGWLIQVTLQAARRELSAAHGESAAVEESCKG